MIGCLFPVGLVQFDPLTPEKRGLKFAPLEKRAGKIFKSSIAQPLPDFVEICIMGLRGAGFRCERPAGRPASSGNVSPVATF